MMHLCGWDEQAVRLTLFTQRVLFHIAVADTLPGTAVAFAYCGVSVVHLVTLGFCFGVLFTEPTIGELGTAGMRTRTLGFLRHSFTSYGTVLPTCI